MEKSVVVASAMRTTVGRRDGGWSAVHPARLPQQVPATTVDAQCGSSQQAFTLAAYRKELSLGRPVPKAYQRHYEF